MGDTSCHVPSYSQTCKGGLIWNTLWELILLWRMGRRGFSLPSQTVFTVRICCETFCFHPTHISHDSKCSKTGYMQWEFDLLSYPMIQHHFLLKIPQDLRMVFGLWRRQLLEGGGQSPYAELCGGTLDLIQWYLHIESYLMKLCKCVII